jgi:hypothetical protein
MHRIIELEKLISELGTGTADAVMKSVLKSEIRNLRSLIELAEIVNYNI